MNQHTLFEILLKYLRNFLSQFLSKNLISPCPNIYTQCNVTHSSSRNKNPIKVSGLKIHLKYGERIMQHDIASLFYDLMTLLIYLYFAIKQSGNSMHFNENVIQSICSILLHLTIYTCAKKFGASAKSRNISQNPRRVNQFFSSRFSADSSSRCYDT